MMMKRRYLWCICSYLVFWLFLFIVLWGCARDKFVQDTPPKRLAVPPVQKTKLRAAVVGFDIACSTYGVKQLDQKAEDMLTTAFIRTGKFQMIDRLRIKKVIEEQILQISGMVDPATAVRIGKILGAQVIVTGSITEMGCSAVSFFAKVTTCRASIDVQLINVETAEIIAAETGEGTSRAVIHYDARQALASKDAEIWVSEALRSASGDVALKIAKMDFR